MTYKGYRAKVDVDVDAGVLHGEVIGLRDVITFEARCMEDLEPAFRASVDDYLAWCEERAEAPERPYSGRLLLRMDPDLHRRLASAAEREGSSLNAYLVTRLEAGVREGPDAPPKARATSSR